MSKVSPEPDEEGEDVKNSKKFQKEGDLDLSQGPAKNRCCTNPEWCLLFLAHMVFFWICALAGASDGDPWKLVNPRDYRGQYCGIEKQWGGGTNLEKFEKAIYTLNLTTTVDPIAKDYICSTTMQSNLVPSVVTASAFTAGCGTSLFTGDVVSRFTNGVDQYIGTANTNVLTGSGTTSILSSIEKYFHPVCVTKCGLTSGDATETITYSPAPDAAYYDVWVAMVNHCASNSALSYCGSALSKFQFSVLPASVCPYSDNPRMKCVLIPNLVFDELSSGYCTPKVVSSTISSAMKGYLDNLAKSGVVNSLSGGLDSAIGDIQNSWDTFILVAVLSFVSGLIYLVLLRFLVKPVVWISIILVFVLFFVGGIAAWAYSEKCADGSFTDAAKSQSSSVTGASSQTCGGYYEISDKTNRDLLKACAVILWIMAGIYLLSICCLFTRIRLAIAINEVAALFVVQTPHILFVPITQVIIGILWCACWMFLAAYLLSQVPKDYVPTSAYSTYRTAMGNSDNSGKCNDMWPAGYAWHDITNSDCKTNKNCWRCAPPRYMFDYRFAFSFFSLLWHNAFFVACGQCIIAGAVGVWFFSSDADRKNRLLSQKGVMRSVKNCFVYHGGSMAFGSFILAVVQFIRWVLYYIKKQAQAQKNKCVEYLACCISYCLWCFEKCIKFLNKNAYIQVALMGTAFCVSARNAFFLILRNALRFGVLGSLGAVIRFIGKGFVMMVTSVLGFFMLKAMHPDMDSPIILVLCYIVIGYFVGALFMNVFGLAVDSTLQCFIATEEMKIDKAFIPDGLQGFIDDTSKDAEKDGCCCRCCSLCCGVH